MPRQKSSIPRYVTMDTQEMSAKIRNISDAELGAWFRKAIIDLCSGCISNDVDPIVEKAYNHSLNRMKSRQVINENNYKNRKSKEDASYREDDENAPSNGITTSVDVSESATSSANSHGAGHNTHTLGDSPSRNDTTAPCNIFQEPSSSEAPLGTSPDSVNGNVSDETTKSSFLAIEDDCNCNSGKSGDVAKAKNAYGEFRHVLLTDAEGAKLRKLYGSNLSIAINILDNYLENNPKKLSGKKAYVNHYGVLRKDNWVYQKVQEIILSTTRLENAKNHNMSFAEQERQRTARALRGESIDGRITVSDEDMSMEELEAVYG